MSISLQGFTINLSIFQISDVIALILVLIITSFNLVPESKVKNKWLRTLIYVGGSVVILVAQHFLLRSVPFLSDPLPSALEVRWYGVMIMLGALAAVLVSAWGAKRKDINPNIAWDMLPWLLIAGIIGARLWHVFTPPADMTSQGLTTQYYLSHPIAILEIWKGGLGIPGAIMGGALACWIYCKVKKQQFIDWMDIVAPGLALAQAIGRWGNFFNQELYGKPTTLPWGMSVNGSAVKYHPLFFYEFLWNLLNFGLLIFLSYKAAKKLIKGDLFLIYVAFYSFGRFWLEFIRADPSFVGGININQTLMAVLFVLSLGYMLFKHLWARKHPQTVTVDVSKKKIITPKTIKKKTAKKNSSSQKKEPVKKDIARKPKKIK